MKSLPNRWPPITADQSRTPYRRSSAFIGGLKLFFISLKSACVPLARSSNPYQQCDLTDGSRTRAKRPATIGLCIQLGKPWLSSMESARFVTAGSTSYSVSIAETSSDSPQGNPSRELHFCGRPVCPKRA